MVVSALVNATNSSEYDFYIEIFNQGSFTKLNNDFIYNGLTSMNFCVINATCILIRHLYHFQIQKIPELFAVIPDIFIVLKDIILKNRD